MLKMRIRVLMLVASLVAVLALATGAYAQDETFGLSEDDFALWAGANANSVDFSSLDYTFTIDASVTVEGETVGISLLGDGVIDTASGALALDLSGNIDQFGPIAISLVSDGESGYIRGIDGTDTWYQISESDLEGIMDGATDALPFDPEALASGDTSELDLDEEAQMEVMGAAFGLIETLPSYVEVTREADDEGAATFYAEFLLEEFLADPSLETIVAAGITSDGVTSFEDAQAQAVEGIGIVAMLAGGSELSYTQYISDDLVEEGILAIVFGGPAAPFGLDFVMDVVINEYDPEVSVEIPAESTPLSEATGGF